MRISATFLRGLAAALVVALSGCAQIEARLDTPPPPPPDIPAPPPAASGAIGSPDMGLSLFEDAKARNVGDLLTIQLVEATTAQKSAQTDSSKNDNATLGNIGIFGHVVHTNSSISSARGFAGKGDSSQSNSLQGSITVAVVRRYANGDLLVTGQKEIQINQGTEYVKLEGVIRPADIAPDNSVSSERVANARISYTGHGQLNDANEQGWLTRFFSSPYMPF